MVAKLPVCIKGPLATPLGLTRSLKDGARVLVISIPVPFKTPMMPLFLVLGSISNSGAAWQAAQPTPPAVLLPEASKTGAVKNKFLPWFSWAVKFGNGWLSLATKALPESYFESNDWMLLMNWAKASCILFSVIVSDPYVYLNNSW